MFLRLLAVVATLNDDPNRTVESILRQSVEVSKIIVAVGGKDLYEKLKEKSTERVEYFYVKPDYQLTVGKRVGAAINKALRKADFEKYDYVLKIDAEILLPANFVEANLAERPDFVGSVGFAMIFKTSSFLRVFGGVYPEVELDDIYFAFKFLYAGCSVKRWKSVPVEMKVREKGYQSFSRYLHGGVEMYRVGYEPVHILHSFLRGVRRGTLDGTLQVVNIVPVFGYFSAVLRNVKRYEFGLWIFRMQVRRLFYGRQFQY